MPSFRAEVQLFGKTATGFSVPPDAVTALGRGQRPPVKVTVAGITYRSTIAPRGDTFFLPLNRANRRAAGVAAGDVVDLTLTLDFEQRIVEVPDGLRKALDGDDEAARSFDGLSSSHQREYVEWITEAKRPETRERRIAKAITMLREGRTQR